MGIILPPLSATIQTPHNGSRHQRNRSLDSVLQKIPELESDSSASGASALHDSRRSADKKKLQLLLAGSVAASRTGSAGHPPLKPCLSLSLDPSSNLFRLKDTRRFGAVCGRAEPVSSSSSSSSSSGIFASGCGVELQKSASGIDSAIGSGIAVSAGIISTSSSNFDQSSLGSDDSGICSGGGGGGGGGGS